MPMDDQPTLWDVGRIREDAETEPARPAPRVLRVSDLNRRVRALLDGDPLLPERSLDLILVVNTYHHFAGGPRYLRRLRRLLRPGGRIVNVDFHRRETPVGPPVERRVAREKFLADARRAGLRVVREETFLPYQYVLVLTPLARDKRS